MRTERSLHVRVVPVVLPAVAELHSSHLIDVEQVKAAL